MSSKSKKKVNKEIIETESVEATVLKAPRTGQKDIISYTEDFSFDYTKPDAYAMFIPSISKNYVGYTSKYQLQMLDDRHPEGMHRDGRELNFLKEDNSSFYYPYALTSAGHANLNIDRDATETDEAIFRKRDKSKTVIIGDSGGYQIGTGVMQFDWNDFEGKKNNEVRLKIIKWLESIADISMTIDVPPWGIEDPRCGVNSFDECLEKTLINHDFVINNRTPGATRFMNVLQGRTVEEGDLWWEVMKDLPFEGWAMAGPQIKDFATIMRRLIIMRDGGYLDKERNWLHFLGVSKLKAACAFTTIQRNIRKHVEPSFTVSYDASSPFLSVAKARLYTGLKYNSKGLTYSSDQAIDNKDLVGSTLPFPLNSPIGRKIKMGDLCVKAHDYVDARGKPSKSSWDSWSYMFMMNHNVYMHTKGVIEANRFYDLPRPHVQNYIPADLLEFRDLCGEIFTSEKPFDLITENARMLGNLSGSRNENNGTDVFSGLFQMENDNTDFSVEEDDHYFDDSIIEE